MKKIDVHVHLGSDPLILREGRKVIGKEVTVSNLIKDMKDNDVEKAVILAFDIPGHEVKDEEIYDISKKFSNKFMPCACVNPLRYKDFGVEKISMLKDFKIIKLMPPYQFFYPDDQKIYPFYEECVRQKKILIFHTGTTDYPSAKLVYGDPLRIDTVAVDFPKLKILMAHSGDPWFKETADIVIKNSNVYADVSGIILGTDMTRGKHSLINFFDRHLSLFPGDKLMYGSDWPFTKMEDYTEVIEKYPFKSEEFVKKLCYKNAEKFLEF